MTLPDSMSGVVLTGHGGPDCLLWRDDLPVPRPRAGEVVIRVAASAVNNTDINARIGWYSKGEAEAADAGWTGSPLPLPLVQGADVCGRVAAVAAGIDPGRVGQRVLVEPCLREEAGQDCAQPLYLGSDVNGGFAQYVRVAARHAHVIDSPLTDAELASFPCSYSTAENLLTRARVTGADRVLVTGASGGAGSAAVQLARARGAEVIAVTSPAKAGLLRDLGAAATLPRDADLVALLGRDSVDVVIDFVGGPGWPALTDVLRPGGRYAVSGAIAGPLVTLDLRTLYLKDLSFFGCTVLDDGVFAALVARIETGAIRPLVAETHDLRDIAAAQASFQSKAHLGKIVLTVP